MQRNRFEDELSRFEAEIGGGGPIRPGFGPPGFGGRGAVPPPPPPAIILNRGSQVTHAAPPTTFYASGPQTNVDAKKVKDEEEDVLATLEKYEKEVKKEAKRKAKHNGGSGALGGKKAKTETISAPPVVQAKATINAKPKTFVPSQLQNVQIPQSTQQRMQTGAKPVPRSVNKPVVPAKPGPSPISSGSGLPVGVKAPPTATMTNEDSWKKAKSKKKTVRTGGGQIWEDETLKEWDPNDFRIFCGDLGNDVTDEVLARVFGRYPSFTKAKVIRDKKTNKTKGYGFVSFREPTDFTKAMREMNGKYVGSRPIKMRKSNWKDRNIDVVRQKQKAKQDMGYKW